MFIIHKGRIFVFLCVQLYITSVSPLPLIERGSILYHNDGNDSTSVDALRRNHVKFISVHDSFHRIPTPVKTPSRRENNRIEVLQEVKVTHKLNNIGKLSGYRKSNAGQDRIFHANSNNDKVTVDVKNPSDNTDSRLVDSWGSEIALAQQESLQPGADDTVHPTNPSSMVLTIASILVGLFGMSVLVAIFQCCCKKKRNDDSVGDKEEKEVKEEKTDDKVDDRRSPSTKDEGDGNDLTQKEVAETSQETKPQNDEAASFKNRIKAFEKTKTPEPSPVSKGPTPKRRPQSEAFKAFEKGLKLPEGLGVQMRKTPSDKKTDKEKSKTDTSVTDDDMAGYKQPENPDVVIADVDDEDTEFGAIKRETEVLRSYRKAPPPKNRNRSSAAFRRKRAQESMADLVRFYIYTPLHQQKYQKNM
ncbi:hypothetical protein FSP39_019374 [Pinctada imbricata]|uniref:Uncharacterized protein n=1 Tax=Pinctada imbricata TaxID=66713 RepID=A0AA89BUK3_PINIB|nr:hypothetical protein FSP39_019374 [Pinctada imbricata]